MSEQPQGQNPTEVLDDTARNRIEQALQDPMIQDLGSALDAMQEPDGSYRADVAPAMVDIAKEVLAADDHRLSYRLGSAIADRPAIARDMTHHVVTGTDNGWDRLAAGVIIDRAATSRTFYDNDPWSMDERSSARRELEGAKNAQAARELRGIAAAIIPADPYAASAVITQYGSLESAGITVEQAADYNSLAHWDEGLHKDVSAAKVTGITAAYRAAPEVVQQLATTSYRNTESLLAIAPYAAAITRSEDETSRDYVQKVERLADVMACGENDTPEEAAQARQVMDDLSQYSPDIAGLTDMILTKDTMVRIGQASQTASPESYQKSAQELAKLSHQPGLFNKYVPGEYVGDNRVVDRVLEDPNEFAAAIDLIDRDFTGVIASGYPPDAAASVTLRIFSQYNYNYTSVNDDRTKPPFVDSLTNDFTAMKLLGDTPVELAARLGGEHVAPAVAYRIGIGKNIDIEQTRADILQVTSGLKEIEQAKPEMYYAMCNLISSVSYNPEELHTAALGFEVLARPEAQEILASVDSWTEADLTRRFMQDPESLSVLVTALQNPLYVQLVEQEPDTEQLRHSALMHPDIWQGAQLPDGMNPRTAVSLIARRFDLVQPGTKRSFESPEVILKLLDDFSALPDRYYGDQIRQAEQQLLRAAQQEDFSKLPAKPGRLNDLFAHDDLQHAYTVALAARKLMPDAPPDASDELAGVALTTPEALILLKQRGAERKQWLADRDSWFRQYMGQPIHGAELGRAWSARLVALSNGADDNPSSIIEWARANELLAYVTGGSSGLTLEYLRQNAPLVNELSRVYSAEASARAIGFFSQLDTQKTRAEALIRPEAVTVNRQITKKTDEGTTTTDREYTVEILDKADPRGFTIGVDTGCCMTIDGASEQCIYAGYSDSRYAFMVVSTGGRVRAQSLLYIGDDPTASSTQAPKVLVIDNIEANAGTDEAQIRGIYSEALQKLIAEKNVSQLPISAVHLGTGYSDVGIDDLPVATTVPTPKPFVYTDAARQRLLLKLPA